jgi:flagellar hook capping protein FlgD
VTFTVPASDLLGVGGNEVHIQFRGFADGAYSDGDCLNPTSGLATIDNIVVSGDNGIVTTTDDFESGLGANWFITFPVSVGDFTKIWPQLASLDPCNINDTPQLGFIDDGVVVPCTGGTLGTSWTYGPGSYTHNLTGGCAGLASHALNELWSPVLDWADGGVSLTATHAGAQLEFNSYTHMPLGNGIFYVWHVRSSDDNGATWSGWADRNYVYYGDNTTYGRSVNEVSDLLQNSPTNVQIALGINELGWVWGFEGTDGTPAPYIDNVSFKVYEIEGPAIATRELEMAQDNFPTIGTIDYTNLGANSVRFDMANDILGDAGTAILPGDSLTYDVLAVRPGAVLNANPQMVYTMKANPLFDSYRLHPTSGTVEGDSVFTLAGALVPDRFSFDLPDEDFFFPGDVIHYYIYAEDNQAGSIQVTTLPGDLSGYGVFPGDPGYTFFDWPSVNICNALPTMNTATVGDQPNMLFFNDFGGRGGENEWVRSMFELGYVEGVDYDVFYVNSPSSGVSNGLGSRATVSQIAGYETMLYTSGNLGSTTLNQYDPLADKSDDLGLLDTWLLSSGKNLLATGDNLVFDLINNQGTSGSNFVTTWFGVSLLGKDISEFNGGVTAPLIVPTGAHSFYDTEMIAFGSCPGLNKFDAVEVQGTAVAIAEWQSLGAYTYAAGVEKVNAGSSVVYFPADFMYWYTPQGFVPNTATAIAAARTDALAEILLGFGQALGSTPTNVPTFAALQASNAPNPFNPNTEIKFSVPRSGDVAIKIFNVRGELVRTLVDGSYESGTHTATWNGTNDSNDSVASGVYFYEVRAGGSTVVNKMALVK